MPYGYPDETQLSPTGLARLQQMVAASQQRPAGYISPGDRRLIQNGIDVGGGYIQINDQVLEDNPSQHFELSDAGKAYLAFRGTDPKLAGIEAEQAQIRSTQKELLARQAGELQLKHIDEERTRGLMSEEEHQKLQTQILQQFNSAKAPSALDYLSTVQDKNDPEMEQTRYNDNLHTTLTALFGKDMDPAMMKAVSGMTSRDKDGILKNEFAMELMKGKIKERSEGAANQRQQMQERLNSLDTNFKSIPAPTAEQQYGHAVMRNKILAEYGQPQEELPAIVQQGRGMFGLGGVVGWNQQAPQSVADMFSAQAQQALQGGNQAPQATQVFGTPNSGPVRVRNDQEIRREIIRARNEGRTSLQYIGPDGKTREIPVN